MANIGGCKRFQGDNFARTTAGEPASQRAEGAHFFCYTHQRFPHFHRPQERFL